MDVCVEQIDFKKVEARISAKWSGPGKVECHDVGPFRCLLTFESRDVLELAINNPLLLSIFDEVKPHWNFVWSPSRRVWVEAMGIPVHVWSKETLDYRTEQCESFSVARLLIDCYEWNRIDEWICLKTEDRQFDIHVREFGGDVYNIPSHPNDSDVWEDGVTGSSESETRIGETPISVGVLPGPVTDSVPAVDSNFQNINRVPEVKVVLKSELGGAKEVNAGDDFARQGEDVTMHADGGGVGVDSMIDVLPMVEIQSEVAQNDLEINDSDSIASDSCPFPPGFSPCTSSTYVHDATHLRGNNKGSSKCAAEKGDTNLSTKNLNPNFETTILDNEKVEMSEALAVKDVCEKGCIIFKAKNEDELLVRLAGRTLQKRDRVRAKNRKKSQNLQQPNIKGRSLSTRFLRSDFIGVAEIKKEIIENSLVREIWGGKVEFKWEVVGSVGASGGIYALGREAGFESWLQCYVPKSHVTEWRITYLLRGDMGAVECKKQFNFQRQAYQPGRRKGSCPMVVQSLGSRTEIEKKYEFYKQVKQAMLILVCGNYRVPHVLLCFMS
ncbi:hypothetical protein PIB30_037266 [Stylosanthes scabra]|uniref:DUF4283 domain-containing protein n=1 Tax=Stylosanthes scabra TaxID=79078 RepID=A0ABU6UFF1_9FABA|nr:hypothetical protein [Stylosanthes scabra]